MEEINLGHSLSDLKSRPTIRFFFLECLCVYKW